MTEIVLPWPDKGLNPNGRLHWSKHARLVQQARSAAFWLTRKTGTAVIPDRPLPLTVTFCPPDRRKRDRTNCEASMKAAFDGMADALQINDRFFEPTYRWGEVVKGGAVKVTLGKQ